MMKVTPRTMSVWVNRFRKDGIEGLREKPGRGAKRRCIPPEQYYSFLKSVETLKKNRYRGRIQARDLGDLIEEKYGKRPSKTTIYRIMNQINLE
jgi:transposase